MNKIVVLVFVVLVMSCGKNEKESFQKESFEDEKSYPQNYDLSTITKDKVEEIERLTREFYENPNDLNKFRKIEKLVGSFKLKKKILEIIEASENEFGKTILSSLLSKYYFKLNDIEKSLSVYDEKIFDTFRWTNSINDLFVEYEALGELLVYLNGERKNYNDSLTVLRQENIYGTLVKRRNILNYLALNHKDALFSQTDDEITINLTHLNKRFYVQNTILYSEKSINIVADNIYFDLISGIQTLNGKSIKLNIDYLENGIFSTTDLREKGKAKSGANGRNAKVSKSHHLKKAAKKGQDGKNGEKGISGGDIVIYNYEMANSLCDKSVCRTILVTNGSKGQDGGDGGAGGNGVKYKIKKTHFHPEFGSTNTFETLVKAKPKAGGKMGFGGKGGSSGRIIIEGPPFSVNSLIQYSYPGPKGKEGTPGKKGKKK